MERILIVEIITTVKYYIMRHSINGWMLIMQHHASIHLRLIWVMVDGVCFVCCVLEYY